MNNLGATYMGDGVCRFEVWAPFANEVVVQILSPEPSVIAMERRPGGYHDVLAEGVKPGSLYMYCLDQQKKRPDPASRYQPQGVHGPSEVVATNFPWEDIAWSGLPLSRYILYELHVGTFTTEGTFDAVIPFLDDLKTLGITAIELMPVAQFPGARNWGYDGAYPFAVQNSYGGPSGLKRLVNACHQKGIAVVLDVVYNHLGPEGNYLGDFGSYFTDRYKTPWGWAINFDGEFSDDVRRFFIENALYWTGQFHMDALRLDAVHAIFDFSAKPFLEALAHAVHCQGDRLNRRIYVIAESALNDPRLIRPGPLGGYGLDAQWNDDFHHALHTVLTGEQEGYYQDFGHFRDLVTAWREGFVYAGRYSQYRKRRHGSSSRDVPAQRLVVFAQNHDQVGNRMQGERLSELVTLEQLKLAAATLLLSPFIPLLFMGEEYGETARFAYFISHSDPDLVKAVRQGRRLEFAGFSWQAEPPDPQDETTFLNARLNHHLRYQDPHRVIYEYYRQLMRLRKEIRALSSLNKENMEVVGLNQKKILLIRRWSDRDEALAVFNFSDVSGSVAVRVSPGRWKKAMDSADTCWRGPGSATPGDLFFSETISLDRKPHSLLLLVKKPAAKYPSAPMETDPGLWPDIF